MILAGREVNDGMGAHVAQRVIRFLCASGHTPATARVGVLGLTFKENVPDLRNSRVPDILEELREYGVQPLVADPMADPEHAIQVAGVPLTSMDDLIDLDALVLAVPHAQALRAGTEGIVCRIRSAGLLVDVKGILRDAPLPEALSYSAL